MHLTPIGNKIIIKPIVEQERKVGSLLVAPPGDAERPTTGVVHAVPPNKVLENGTNIPFEVSTGDLVLFGKFAGKSFKIEDQEYIAVSEDEIIGILS